MNRVTIDYELRPPFEVMEVWLESLSMHLSVGMPLPPDLLFDIQHYRGLSPSSSGSTTPEGIPSGHRSPALEPIREGKMATSAQKSSEKLYKSNDKLESSKPIIKVSSAENLLNNRRDNVIKPIIKVSSSDALVDKAANEEFCTKSCEDVAYSGDVIQKLGRDVVEKEFPNYENIDFLKNDAAFAGDAEKPICIQKLGDTELKKDVDKGYCSLRNQGNNAKDPKFNVHLRKVPKNFTRNRFVKEIKENALREEDVGSVRDKIKFLGKTRTFDIKPLANTAGKISNLNLDNIGSRSTTQVTEKFMNNSKNVNVSKEDANKPQNVQPGYRRSESCHTDRIPDVVSSTLPNKPSCSHDKPSFSIGRHIFNRSDSNPPPVQDCRSTTIRNRYAKDAKNSPVLRRTPVMQRRTAPKGEHIEVDNAPGHNLRGELLYDKQIPPAVDKRHDLDCRLGGDGKQSLLTKLTPILQRRTGFLKLEPSSAELGRKPFSATTSGSLVRNMVNSLNKKGGIGFGSRGTYGRSSLKVTGSPRVDLKGVGRSCSPTEEYTAL